MVDPVTVAETAAEEEWAWRLVKKKDSPSATLELGEMYADAPDPVVERLIHVIGESLVKAGMQMVQSRLVDEDEDDDDDADYY
jgi:hypothetical protein